MYRNLVTAGSAARWDLRDVYPDDDAARTAAAVGAERAGTFRRRYRGRIADLDPAELAAALGELAALRALLSRVAAYARLRSSVNVGGEAEATLSAVIGTFVAEATESVQFFELEWARAGAGSASTLVDHPALARYRHFLVTLRRFAPHLLDEHVEGALAARDWAATEAWQALYDRISATTTVALDGHTLAVDEAFSHLAGDSARLRRAALGALDRAIEPHLHTIAHCYDTLVCDRLAVDELRGHSSPRAERDLENELSPVVVDSMLDAVERHADIIRDWYERKAALLGCERLSVADRLAPTGDSMPIACADAVRALLDALAGLSPRLAAAGMRFVQDNRIDSAPRAGKAGNASCTAIAPAVTPYVLVNYANGASDAATLAHEVGHGLHYLFASAEQTPLSFDAPIALSEVAPALLELATLDELVKRAPNVAARRTLLTRKVEASLEIFRQTIFTRFEEQAYHTRRAGEVLSVERLGEIWTSQHRRMYGDSLALPSEHSSTWAYIPHFFGDRFHNYAYVFAGLTALALSRLHADDPAGFGDGLVTFLSRGGSADPVEQLAELGFDPTASGAWDAALGRLGDLAEAASRRL